MPNITRVSLTFVHNMTYVFKAITVQRQIIDTSITRATYYIYLNALSDNQLLNDEVKYTYSSLSNITNYFIFKQSEKTSLIVLECHQYGRKKSCVECQSPHGNQT